jgi:DNA-binding transcriptional ArsR family regulator
MKVSGLPAVTLTVLLAMVATVAAQEADPCAVSQAACDTGSAVYDTVQDLFDADPGDGMEGIVAAVVAAQPDTQAVWSFPRILDPMMNSAATPSPETEVPWIVLPEVPSESTQAQARLAADGAFRGLEEAAALVHAKVPTGPDTRLGAFLTHLGTLEVNSFLPTAPAPGTRAEPPRRMALREGAGAPAGFGAEESLPAGGEGALVAGPPLDNQAPLLAGPAPAAAPWPEAIGDLLAPWFAGFEAMPVAALLFVLLLIPPLYSRIHREKLLDHPLRAKLYEVVAAHPGIHIEELARVAGMSRSTTVYHLHLLVRHGHLTALGRAKTTHYYANNGRTDPDDKERRALLASPRARALAAAIAENPGVTRLQVGAMVGIGASTVSWHLGRLMALGLVREQPVLDGRGLYSGPGLIDLLRPWSAADAAVEPPATAFPEPATAETVPLPLAA